MLRSVGVVLAGLVGQVVATRTVSNQYGSVRTMEMRHVRIDQACPDDSGLNAFRALICDLYVPRHDCRPASQIHRAHCVLESHLARGSRDR